MLWKLFHLSQPRYSENCGCFPEHWKIYETASLLAIVCTFKVQSRAFIAKEHYLCIHFPANLYHNSVRIKDQEEMHRETNGAVIFCTQKLHYLFYFWTENYRLKHFCKCICFKGGHSEVSTVLFHILMTVD